MRRPQFVNNEFYHIVNRGVEQRNIFLDEEDRLRFVNSLLVFNDRKPAFWSLRGFWNTRNPNSLLREYKPKESLVEIHTFTLMNNHFHLLLRQLTNSGISDFMRKIGGYAYYFNKKYQRIGSLFQGRFKALLIKDENQLKNTFVYIHTNPVEIIENNWKKFEVKDPESAIKFIEAYRWSSYPDYLTAGNFSNLLIKNFFLKLFDGKENCKQEIDAWIKFKVDRDKFNDIILE